ncbi:hypothetical protein [Psychrobacillus sp.]|uniref:hypothetical protein n=1 Tax=Psychrobacillus sp. TaxID=1871623 RepID=UPI0028BE4731|nr:hypothetical protein [Psychrobacillus sp.]
MKSSILYLIVGGVLGFLLLNIIFTVFNGDMATHALYSIFFGSLIGLVFGIYKKIN